MKINNYVTIASVSVGKLKSVSVGKLINRILGSGLLISSLPGKAWRTLVGIARPAERFNMRFQNRAW